MRRRELLVLGAGTAIAWSLAVRAQHKEVPVIGYLRSGSAGPLAAEVAAFQRGLAETGYVAGQNVSIEYRWTEGQKDQFPVLAADRQRLMRGVGTSKTLFVRGRGYGRTDSLTLKSPAIPAGRQASVKDV